MWSLDLVFSSINSHIDDKRHQISHSSGSSALSHGSHCCPLYNAKESDKECSLSERKIIHLLTPFTPHLQPRGHNRTWIR